MHVGCYKTCKTFIQSEVERDTDQGENCKEATTTKKIDKIKMQNETLSYVLIGI